METIDDIRNLPELDAGTIHIWGVHVPDMQNQLGALEEILSIQEREKTGRLHREADRQSSICARGALRVLLSGYTGVQSTDLAFRYVESGKPFLVPPASSRLGGKQGRQVACDTIAFNVSHSGDWVVLAIGREQSIGVDIEKIKRNIDVRSLAARFFEPSEIELIQTADDPHTMFFQLWVRKEAYIKARGATLLNALGSFSVPIKDGRLPETGESNGWYFHGLNAGSKYAAAVVSDRELDSVPCYDFGGLKWGN